MNKAFGIIFDMDGVLVHSNPTHKKAIHQFCKKHGIETSEDFLRERIYGRTNKEWIPELVGEISPDRLTQLADEKEQLFRDLFDPRANIVSGLIPFLEELKAASVKCAVATSAPGENADYILSALDIEQYFSTVLDSSHIDKGKPDPGVYLKASKKLGFPPENCIVVEDSLAGVEAGVRAGSKVVGVTTTHKAEELQKCDIVIDSFSELSVEKLEHIIG